MLEKVRCIGRYEVLRTLSQRAASEVLLVRHPAVTRPLALKRLRRRGHGDWATVARFRDAAAAATTLRHPNIVRAHCVGGGRHEAFVVTDHVRGIGLETLLRRAARPLDPTATVSIAFSVICALRYAHHGVAGRTMAHESVAPRSIRLGTDGSVTLVDFGTSTSSRWTSEEPCAALGCSSPSTDSPDPMDLSGDLYGLGAVLYEMLTAVAAPTVLDPWLPPPGLVPATPAALERIVVKALHRDRAQRYRTADEMWRDLEALAAQPQLAPSRSAVARAVAPYA